MHRRIRLECSSPPSQKGEERAEMHCIAMWEWERRDWTEVPMTATFSFQSLTPKREEVSCSDVSPRRLRWLLLFPYKQAAVVIVGLGCHLVVCYLSLVLVAVVSLFPFPPHRQPERNEMNDKHACLVFMEKHMEWCSMFCISVFWDGRKVQWSLYSRVQARRLFVIRATDTTLLTGEEEKWEWFEG